MINKCKYCGKEVTQGRNGRRKYCNDDHYLKQNAIEIKEKKKHKKKFEPIPCAYRSCGKMFTPMKSTNNYCTKDCRTLYYQELPKEARQKTPMTLDPKFLHPRGSKQRKEIGLEPIEFGGTK